VTILVQCVYENRLDLSESDEAWITALWNRRAASLRRRDLGRLRQCAIQIGEIEAYMDVA